MNANIIAIIRVLIPDSYYCYHHHCYPYFLSLLLLSLFLLLLFLPHTHVLQITNGSQLRRFQLGEDEQDLSQRLGHQFGLSENAVYLAVLLRNMVINPTSLGYFPTNPKFDSGIIHFKRCGKYYNCIVSVLL